MSPNISQPLSRSSTPGYNPSQPQPPMQQLPQSTQLQTPQVIQPGLIQPQQLQPSQPSYHSPQHHPNVVQNPMLVSSQSTQGMQVS